MSIGIHSGDGAATSARGGAPIAMRFTMVVILALVVTGGPGVPAAAANGPAHGTAGKAASDAPKRPSVQDARDLEVTLRTMLGNPPGLEVVVYPADPAVPGTIDGSGAARATGLSVASFPLVEARMDDGRIGRIPVTHALALVRDVKLIQRPSSASADLTTPRIIPTGPEATGDQAAFDHATVSRLDVVLDEDDLARSLAGGLLGRMARDVTVNLAPGRLTLEGKVGQGLLAAKARLWGHLELSGDCRKVSFALDGLDCGPFVASAATARTLIARYNPVLDLATFQARTGVDVRLSTIAIEEGRLVIRGGDGVPPALP